MLCDAVLKYCIYTCHQVKAPLHTKMEFLTGKTFLESSLGKQQFYNYLSKQWNLHWPQFHRQGRVTESWAAVSLFHLKGFTNSQEENKLSNNLSNTFCLQRQKLIFVRMRESLLPMIFLAISAVTPTACGRTIRQFALPLDDAHSRFALVRKFAGWSPATSSGQKANVS